MGFEVTPMPPELLALEKAMKQIDDKIAEVQNTLDKQSGRMQRLWTDFADIRRAATTNFASPQEKQTWQKRATMLKQQLPALRLQFDGEIRRFSKPTT